MISPTGTAEIATHLNGFLNEFQCLAVYYFRRWCYEYIWNSVNEIPILIGQPKTVSNWGPISESG